MKGVIDVVVGLCVVEVNTNGLLNIRQVEIIIEVLWWGWIVIGMTNVIDTTTAVFVIWLFYIGATLICGLDVFQQQF